MFAGLCAYAQDFADNVSSADSLMRVKASYADTTLIGRNIFSLVNVRQSSSIASAMNQWRAANPDRVLKGYRISIFSESRQTARSESETVVERFKVKYPGIEVYRFYANPEFRVYVGDFRDKSEVTRFLNQILAEYPSAFVVETNINYPKMY